MKTTLQFGLLAMLLAATIVGCSDMQNPAESHANEVTVSQFPGLGGSHILPTILPAFDGVIVQPPAQFPKTVVEASALITPALGGKVDLKSVFYDPIGKKNVSISWNLKVPANAVSQNTTITMKLDEDNLLAAVEFSPCGTVFSKPAMFNVTCTGLDLGTLRTGDVDLYLYYDNSGDWTEQNIARKVAINAKKGELVMKDIPMNHFSRYAFGRLSAM